MSLSNSLPTEFSVGLTWDAAGSSCRPADLDVACLALDPTGLIMDACFFNNPVALGGAMRHSGDSRDGAAPGIDEFITVSTAMLPPYTYALVFVAMCANDGDFGPCESAQMHCFSLGTALTSPVALGQAAAQRSTVVVLGIARRSSAGWALEATVRGFPAPARSFMDVYRDILPMVAIDPVMAEELKSRQPVFSLKKGEAVTLPVGLTSVMFGLGWDSRCDVDASCVGLSANGSSVFTVYFSDKKYRDVVEHSGDNLTGEGGGDDERILVKLDSMPPEVDSIFFTVNVFSSSKNFTDVESEYCRLVDVTTGRELVRFNSLDSGEYNGVVLVGLYRNKAFPQQWSFKATALPAMGRTVRDLVDECQALQRSHRAGDAPLPPKYQQNLDRARQKADGSCCVVQ